MYIFKAGSELETVETYSEGNVITYHMPVHQTIHNSKLRSLRKIHCDMIISACAMLDNDTAIELEL
jgi:hypothetical protein